MVKIYLLLFVLFFLPCQVFADHSTAPTNYYPIGDKVQEGSIITVLNGRYTLSNAPDDQFTIGIVTSNPAITQKFSGPTPYYPVITSGIGYILVSSINGPIKKGDYITTSVIPGVGQRASDIECTLGIAQDNFYENKDVIGKIPIMINIQHGHVDGAVESNIESVVRYLITRITPVSILKVSLAVTVIIASMVLSFRVLGRAAKRHVRVKERKHFLRERRFFDIVAYVLTVLGILYVGFSAGALLMGM